MVYKAYRQEQPKDSQPCPDEETLVCFSEGRLTKPEIEKIQEHLIICSRCAEILSLLSLKGLQEQKEVPESLLQKAKDLVSPVKVLPTILELVIALKEKALEILDTTGDVILGNEIMPLPVLRSRNIRQFQEEINLIKEFGDVKINLTVEKRGRDKVRISLTLVDKSSLLPLQDLRLSLLKDGVEMESYTVASGNAVFEELDFGRYAIEVYRREEKIGFMVLQIQ